MPWPRTSAPKAVPDQRRDEAGEADALRLELLDAVLETVDVGIVACDAAGHLTLFNTAARRFHGLAHDPGVDAGQWPQRFDLYDADGVERLRPQEVPLYRALVDGRVSGVVITIAPPGSSPRHVRCDGQQLRDDDGTVTGAVAVMTDVTDARRAAAALARETALSASIAAASRDAYVGTDERGQVVVWNRAAEELLGIAADDALGRELVGFAPPAVSPAYQGRLRAFLRDGAAHTAAAGTTLTFTHADGRELPLAVTVWAQPTGTGWGFHAFFRQAT